MNVPSDPLSAPTLELQVLSRHLTSPEALMKRLHVPRLIGLMQHIPGKPFHVMPELFFQVAGINRIEFPAEVHLLKAGCACLIPRSLPHGETLIPVRGRVHMLVLMFDNNRIRVGTGGNVLGRPPQTQPWQMETPEAGRIANALDDLARLAQASDPWSTAARRGLSFGILGWLGATLQTHPSPDRYSPKITQTLYLISSHLENPALGTATLAQWIGCAPNYLSDRFHRETGEPLSRHITFQRLTKARYLLEHSLMSVKEVASACGFGDPDYFGRQFLRGTGQTPTQYRSTHYRS